MSDDITKFVVSFWSLAVETISTSAFLAGH